MEVKKYWEQGVSFDDYLEKTEEIVAKNESDLTEQERAMFEYYKLGVQRMNRMKKSFQVDSAQVKKLQAKNFKGNILIISEAWCGDAGQTVPAVSLFFKDQNEVRIVYRDQHPELIDQFLTNGARSIPIVLILDENYELVTHWGPRPKPGIELFKKFKANPETYSKEQFHNDIQVYYAKNKGKDTIEEIVDLM